MSLRHRFNHVPVHTTGPQYPNAINSQDFFCPYTVHEHAGAMGAFVSMSLNVCRCIGQVLGTGCSPRSATARAPTIPGGVCVTIAIEQLGRQSRAPRATGAIGAVKPKRRTVPFRPSSSSSRRRTAWLAARAGCDAGRPASSSTIDIASAFRARRVRTLTWPGTHP